MISDAEYYSIISEYYDLSDYKTKRSLIFCNEAQKMTNIENIVSKLYNHIKTNCTGIDFGTIPASKGIITKVDNYQNIVDCLNTVKDLVVEYNENTKLVDTLFTAIDNVQQRERLFTKAFALNIDLPIMIYNMTVMSIVAGTSLLVATCVEYVKDGHDSFTMSFDRSSYKKSQNHVLYQYAEQFNRECAKGNIDRIISQCVKSNLTASNMHEDTIDDVYGNAENVGGVVGIFKTIGGLISGFFSTIGSLFGIIRLAVFYFLKMRMDWSDWFANQAAMLEINANNIKYKEGDESSKKSMYQKQMKMVERFKKISNMIALKDSKAQKDAKTEDDNYSKKRKQEENNDNKNNDSSNDDGGLF